MTTDTLQQKDQGFMTYPASGWHKLAFKAPVHLWRLGLEPLMGKVFMLITHTGRKSGLPRRTLVEYHTAEGNKYVPCAFGERAQWYKNIVADPNVTIQTAGGAESMKARRVTEDEELRTAVNLLRWRNPKMLGWYLQSVGVEDNFKDISANKDRIHIITFDPTDEPTPPPLEADLKWVWGMVAGFFLLRRLLKR